MEDLVFGLRPWAWAFAFANTQAQKPKTFVNKSPWSARLRRKTQA